MVFVVDQNGRAVAHPEASVAFSEKPMTDLKVVQEWLESGDQVQSALAPFSATRDGKSVEMLGSYATAELDKTSQLGVIAIQDEALWVPLIYPKTAFLVSSRAQGFSITAAPTASTHFFDRYWIHEA